MNFIFFHIPPGNREVGGDIHALITDEEQLRNITDGSEFLDDAIRMKEQPLVMHTEESIAPGSPENLF
jgi:hypothetical protein